MNQENTSKSVLVRHEGDVPREPSACGYRDRLIELGKPFDYMVYPNRDHGLREGRGSELHVRMLIMTYLLEHLAPGPR